METITETLKKRLEAEIASGVSVYAIAKRSGIHKSILGRFLSDERKKIRLETADKLADYFGLELAPRIDRHD